MQALSAYPLVLVQAPGTGNAPHRPRDKLFCFGLLSERDELVARDVGCRIAVDGRRPLPE
jgi:hypothetical protein